MYIHTMYIHVGRYKFTVYLKVCVYAYIRMHTGNVMPVYPLNIFSGFNVPLSKLDCFLRRLQFVGEHVNFSTPNAHPFITTARRRPSKTSTVSLSPPHVILSPERRTGPTMPIANYKGAEWRALFGIPNGPASSPL